MKPFRYNPRKLNLAYMSTRGQTVAKDVVSECIGQQGPKFLSVYQTEWPVNRKFVCIIPKTDWTCQSYNIGKRTGLFHLFGKVLGVLAKSKDTVKNKLSIE